MEVKLIKNVLEYIDCGIVDNNCHSNYRVYMSLIHNFLLNSEEINSEFLFELFKQTKLIILKLSTHENADLWDDYYKMKGLILQSLGENKEE